jgi:hypothetical protein
MPLAANQHEAIPESARPCKSPNVRPHAAVVMVFIERPPGQEIDQGK